LVTTRLDRWFDSPQNADVTSRNSAGYCGTVYACLKDVAGLVAAILTRPNNLALNHRDVHAATIAP
jgi:hypothetical protein